MTVKYFYMFSVSTRVTNYNNSTWVCHSSVGVKIVLNIIQKKYSMTHLSNRIFFDFILVPAKFLQGGWIWRACFCG